MTTRIATRARPPSFFMVPAAVELAIDFDLDLVFRRCVQLTDLFFYRLTP